MWFPIEIQFWTYMCIDIRFVFFTRNITSIWWFEKPSDFWEENTILSQSWTVLKKMWSYFWSNDTRHITCFCSLLHWAAYPCCFINAVGLPKMFGNILTIDGCEVFCFLLLADVMFSLTIDLSCRLLSWIWQSSFLPAKANSSDPGA